ncbi:hypothetical protein ACO22_04052 [Paracoccidioides brasiliensis]|uniref:Uncharacterized protein n=1 Tax=Paracoccidioides brasiliensis TaxID=121759 RepID=A0A1D2JE61_PARBR|nr:hypothetical protein ACO22_04052 [Paracoccidioides brasiliensis]
MVFPMAVPSITAATSWLHAISHIDRVLAIVEWAGCLEKLLRGPQGAVHYDYRNRRRSILPMIPDQYANTWDAFCSSVSRMPQKKVAFMERFTWGTAVSIILPKLTFLGEEMLIESHFPGIASGSNVKK